MVVTENVLENQLATIMRPSELDLLLRWIAKQPMIPIWDNGQKGARPCMLRIAVVLAQSGMTLSCMTGYAIQQVMELFKDDPNHVALEGVAEAYAAIHTAGNTGPATKGVLRTVISAYRR